MVYALADRGARLLIERDGIEFANVEWSRKNREAGRPFIEHQLEIMDFYVTLQCAARGRGDVRLIHPDELVASFRISAQTRVRRLRCGSGCPMRACCTTSASCPISRSA